MTTKTDTSVGEALTRAAEIGARFYEDLAENHVAASVGYAELRERLNVPLTHEPIDAVQVIEDLSAAADGGLLSSGSPRFFGWVIGGVTPAALAADWLAAAWDQNCAIYAVSPLASVVEEVAGEWLKDVLQLPRHASCAFVTGCQMAHFTGLAAARHRLLADRGIDVERSGLTGAPQFRVVTGGHRHESLLRALRFLGLGLDALRPVGLDPDGRIDLTELTRVLDEDDGPTIVVLQAGDLNTGASDPFEEACAIAHDRGAWVHVDGAFGLWLAASERHREEIAGHHLADSWATDGHKWLQLTYDHGFAFVRDAEAHHAAMATHASYFIDADGTGRDAMQWNPEWSRRSRGIVTYAAMRALGRDGIERVVDECCRLAGRIVDEIGTLDGAEILAPARMNQGLVRFLTDDGDHDARTDAVTEALQREGTAWFGPTTWNGKRAMRVSVCNFRTTDEDVDRTVDAVRRVLAGG